MSTHPPACGTTHPPACGTTHPPAREIAIPPAPVYPHVLAIVARTVIEPVTGARYYSRMCWQRGFSVWSPERREAWQRRRLRDIVNHAIATVEAYREVPGVAPDEAIADVLARLPVITKDDLRRGMAHYTSSARIAVIRKSTGGTSGMPLSYPLDRDAWSHMCGAQLLGFERTGYRYGDRVAMFGTPASLWSLNWRQRIRHAIERHDFTLTDLDINPVASRRRVRAALASGAVLWYGYAGTIAEMARALLDDGGPVAGPRAIVTTSEPLHPEWRRLIEAAFGVPVHDQFGCNDGGVFAQSCGAGRFHLADSLSIAETLVDGRPAAPGEAGDLVITNLHARAMPFLRYHAGDRAVLGTDPCPCGVPGPTIAALAGRATDQLRLPNGRVLSAVTFAPLFVSIERVHRWQVVQAGPGSLRIRIVPLPGFGAAEVGRIREFIATVAGPGVDVTVVTDEPIELTPGGKGKLVAAYAPPISPEVAVPARSVAPSAGVAAG